MSPRFKELLARTWLALAVGCMVLLGLLFPEVGLALPRYHIIDAGVVTVMFLGGLRLSQESFRRAATRVPLLLGSLVFVFGLAPLLAWGLGDLFGLSSLEERTAVLLCSTQASTLATAIVLTEVAGGDVALAMVMTLVNNAASVLLTPLAFRIFVGAEISVDHWSMSLELLLKILCPVIAAQVARIFLAAPARRHGKTLSLVSQIIVLSYIFAGVAAGQRFIADHPTTILEVFALVASLHLLLLILSAASSRVMCRLATERVPFILCSSQKTLPAAMLLWKSHFPLLPLGPVVAVAYHMLQLVVDSLLAASLTRLPFIADGRDKR